jgi:hypothetical protein
MEMCLTQTIIRMLMNIRIIRAHSVFDLAHKKSSLFLINCIIMKFIFIIHDYINNKYLQTQINAKLKY